MATMYVKGAEESCQGLRKNAFRLVRSKVWFFTAAR